jgi:ubiquinol-cytochrome c reductase cytochrome b subunit
MLSAILILLAMPFTDLSRSRGIQFRPLSKIAFYIFIANFLILMVLGAKHVESPFIELGQICTVLYFAHFLIIVPGISLLENSLVELNFSGFKKYIERSIIAAPLINVCTIHGVTAGFCQACWNIQHANIIACHHQ